MPLRRVTEVPSAQRMVALPSEFCCTVQERLLVSPSSEHPIATDAHASAAATRFHS
jgi:hypothetical protein